MSMHSAAIAITRILGLTRTRLFKFSLIAVALLGTALLSRPIFAAVNPIFQNYIESTNDNAAPNRTNMVGHGMLWEDLAPGMAEGLVGKEFMAIDPVNPPADATSYLPGGIMGTTTNLVASLYTPQASGVEYIASTWNGFLGKPAYAQGAGFQGLSPILPLWRGLRNIVYLLSSLFFIVIGIMIILRVKISPQAVINIQNSIPQLITTLILVTFSYAIAGLLIDLTNLVQGVAISTLFTAFGRNPGSSLFSGSIDPIVNIAAQFGINLDGNYNMASLLANNGFFQTFGLISRLIPTLTLTVLGGFIGAIAGAITGAGIGAIPGGVVGGVLGLLIISVIVLINLFGFLFSLLKVYINVLIKIIFSPLEIGLGALPGSKTNFSSWLWELIGYLAVFPFSLIFLLVANLIVVTIANGQLWTPPIVGGLGTLAGGRILAGLIGFGAFLLFAKLPDKIPALIFQIKPSEWGKAIGESSIPAIAKGGLQTYSGWEQKNYAERVAQKQDTRLDKAVNSGLNILGFRGVIKR